jgi:hypothetical protein
MTILPGKRVYVFVKESEIGEMEKEIELVRKWESAIFPERRQVFFIGPLPFLLC